GYAPYQTLAALPIDILAVSPLQTHAYIFCGHLIANGACCQVRKWQNALILAFRYQTTFVFTQAENRKLLDFFQFLMPYIAFDQIVSIAIFTCLLEHSRVLCGRLIAEESGQLGRQ